MCAVHRILQNIEGGIILNDHLLPQVSFSGLSGFVLDFFYCLLPFVVTHNTGYASAREELCSNSGGNVEDNFTTREQTVDRGGEVTSCYFPLSLTGFHYCNVVADGVIGSDRAEP